MHTEIALHHQFLVGAHPIPDRPEWRTLKVGEYWVAAHESLPVQITADRVVLGWKIGDGGRYAELIGDRLYLDPGGTLAAVYSPRRQMAGSTVSALVMSEAHHPVWADRTGFPDERANQFYPAGLTMDASIQRLLPNHYLDLTTWRAVRHHFPPPAVSVSDAIGRIVEILKAQIRSIDGTVYLPLTGGRDSRMVVACSRGMDATYVTFDYGRHNYSDLRAARHIAERFGLRHVVLTVPSMAPEDKRQYLQRVGYAGGSGKSGDFWAACLRLERSAAWLTGFAAEVGRAFYWRRGDRVITAEDLLARMRLPITFIDDMRVWLKDFDGAPASTVLDFAYLEHRLGCWASPHMYGGAPFRMSLTPFCHREIIDLMLGLPPDYKMQQRLAHDVISAAWPKLAEVPFDEPAPAVRWARQHARRLLYAINPNA